MDVSEYEFKKDRRHTVSYVPSVAHIVISLYSLHLQYIITNHNESFGNDLMMKIYTHHTDIV